MDKFDKDTFIKLHDKYNNFTNKLSSTSYEKYENLLISFNDFLINFHIDNKLLYNSATTENDNYYIIKGTDIINEFKIIKFKDYEEFLIKNYTYFESITAECIYLFNN